MELSHLSVFKRLNARMRWLTARQAVLAQNVANVDTPGYMAREIKAPSFGRALALMKPAETSAPSTAGHVRLASKMAAEGTSVVRENVDVSLSGNSVDLEQELKKSADAAMDYQTMSHLYRKHMEMLRMAVQSNGS